MPVYPIAEPNFKGNWVTVQMRLASGQFGDTAPSADIGGGGVGPFLVFERGIYKYPEQAGGGRFVVPRDVGKPVRLTNLTADFGASTAYAVHVAGIDGTAQRPNNTSGSPYASGNAALYQEGDIIVHSGTAQYVSVNLDPVDAGESALIHPGQHVYVTTVAATANAVIRLTFNLAAENIG